MSVDQQSGAIIQLTDGSFYNINTDYTSGISPTDPIKTTPYKGAVKINYLNAIPDIANWGRTGGAALQVQGATVFDGTFVQKGFFKHNPSVTRSWDQYGMLADFGGTQSSFFDPTVQSLPDNPNVISGDVPMFRFSSVQFSTASPSLIQGHLATVQISGSPVYDQSSVTPYRSVALHVKDGRVVFDSTVGSESLTEASLILNGGMSIACTESATSIEQGGALTIGGGLAVAKNSRFGDKVQIGYDESETFQDLGSTLKVYGNVSVRNGHLNFCDNLYGQIANMRAECVVDEFNNPEEYSWNLEDGVSNNMLKMVSRGGGSTHELLLANALSMFIDHNSDTVTLMSLFKDVNLSASPAAGAALILGTSGDVSMPQNVTIKSLVIDGTDNGILLKSGPILSSDAATFLGKVTVDNTLELGDHTLFATSESLSIISATTPNVIISSTGSANLYVEYEPKLSLFSKGVDDSSEHYEKLLLSMDGTDFAINTLCYGSSKQRALKLSATPVIDNVVLNTDGSVNIGQNLSISYQGAMSTLKPVSINDSTRIANNSNKNTMIGALNVVGDIVGRSMLIMNPYLLNQYNTPTLTSRSGGTRIILDSSLSPLKVDTAIGVSRSGMWHSVPSYSSGFSWYAGVNKVMDLSGEGDVRMQKSLTLGSVDTNIKIQPASDMITGYTLTLPSQPPSQYNILSVDGQGNLKWDLSIVDANGLLKVTGVSIQNDQEKFASIVSSNNMLEDYTVTFPPVAPTETSVMTIDSAGQISWSTIIPNGILNVDGLKLINGAQHTTAIVSSDLMTNDYTVTLPAVEPTQTSVLTIDQTGQISWSTGIPNGVLNINGIKLVNDANFKAQIVASSTMASDYTFTLPGVLPTQTSVLTLDSSGQINWASSLSNGQLNLTSLILKNTQNKQVTLQPAATVPSNYTLTLPTTLPLDAVRRYLVANTSGSMSWVEGSNLTTPSFPQYFYYGTSGQISPTMSFTGIGYAEFSFFCVQAYTDTTGYVHFYPIKYTLKIRRNEWKQIDSPLDITPYILTVTTDPSTDSLSYLTFSLVSNILNYSVAAYKQQAAPQYSINYSPPTRFGVTWVSQMINFSIGTNLDVGTTVIMQP